MASSPSTASTSWCPTAPSSACWAPTARARRRSSARSATSSASPPARRASSATTTHPRRPRLIGLAEQDVNLDRFLDVEETLLYHGGYYGMERARARRRAGEMMDVFDLRAKAHVRAPMLSGGMRRRLLLARALMHEPRAGHPRRADRRRRLRAAPGAVGLHPPPARRGDDDPAHHALPRGGRGAVRGDRAHPRRAPARARQRRGLRDTFGADSLADVYVKAMAS